MPGPVVTVRQSPRRSPSNRRLEGYDTSDNKVGRRMKTLDGIPE